jgi:hypothetical protein
MSSCGLSLPRGLLQQVAVGDGVSVRALTSAEDQQRDKDNKGGRYPNNTFRRSF